MSALTRRKLPLHEIERCGTDAGEDPIIDQALGYAQVLDQRGGE